jgi:hypothetical protein
LYRLDCVWKIDQVHGCVAVIFRGPASLGYATVCSLAFGPAGQLLWLCFSSSCLPSALAFV